MGKLVDVFSKELKTLTSTEKQILYYIENHLKEASNMPLTLIAEENNVSTTTVVRLSQKLGFSGFSEFKFNLKQLAADFATQSTSSDKDPFDLYMNVLTEGLSKIDREVIIQAAKQMIEADRVIVISVGLTKMMGEYMSKRLMQLHCSSSYIYESHMINLITNWVNVRDCVVFISASGDTTTLLNAAEKLDSLMIPTIALTNNPDSPLMQNTDLGLSLPIQSQLYEGYDISGRSSLVLLSDLLIDYYLLMREEE